MNEETRKRLNAVVEKLRGIAQEMRELEEEGVVRFLETKNIEGIAVGLAIRANRK